ncbi:hypothetical protein BJY01DRAFT_249685 [Aspergillus pseudoustus]|uniref:Uncharacterized protein n=1 Tax=Aspergillus pseudoustus TaxID=1810923 RepID=A0ABR4JND9_9EURO
MAGAERSNPSLEDFFVRATISEQESSPEAGRNADHGGNNLSKRLYEVELHAFERNKGALRVSAHGPTTFSASVSTEMYWQGMTEESESYLKGRRKVWPRSKHPSFESYRKRKFMKELPDTNWAWTDDEDATLLDVECYAYYESPSVIGTVTLEGFGLECWAHTEPQILSVPVSYAQVPEIPLRKLLRRMDELRSGEEELGQHRGRDLWNLLEMVGDEGLSDYTARNHPDKTLHIPDLYEHLNRRDLSANFGEISSVTIQAYATDGYTLPDFMWQIILAKELARRLERWDQGGAYAGFTEKILASLIVADRWFKNTEFVLEDVKEDFSKVGKPGSDERRARAEELKKAGNTAMDRRQYESAVELYKLAIEIDGLNAVYRCNLSAALACLGQYWASQEAATIATQLDPGYAKAWARLGFAELSLGRAIQAKYAYSSAIEVAGAAATMNMKQGLVDAQARIDASLGAIERERFPDKQHELRKAFLDQNWDVTGKELRLHSRVHEQQAEGLLVFAEAIKWPYINEVREHVKDVYRSVLAGGDIGFYLHDWMVGVMLPGKWFSFTIMSALIMSTASIAEDLGAAPYYESGLSLPESSYWRVRSVLGRVLASLPGVTSLSGWIGPCPPVEVVGWASEKKPRHVNFKAPDVLPSEYTTVIDLNDVFLEPRPEAPPMRLGEDAERYIADIEDSSQWIIPEPPVPQSSSCEVKSIRLNPLPLEPDVAGKVARGELDQLGVDNETQYLASIDFQLGGGPNSVTYTLSTNPVFISLKPCFPGIKGAHPVHKRVLPKYQTNIWTVEKLKDFIPPETTSDEVIIINATGDGERALAQAWCAGRGKNAIIRTDEGPCFACAVRAARKLGLGIDVLIWAS